MDFSIGKTVMLISPEFEFYLRGNPSGEYTKGIIQKKNGSTYLVKLLCNGEVYEVKENILMVI